MSWTKRKQSVIDEAGNLVAILPEDDEFGYQKLIVNAGEALELISDFVEQVNSGSLKPRTSVKKFESFLNKIS